ncbi:MAG: ABC transporter permease subunit [Dakarella massiliensis]
MLARYQPIRSLRLFPPRSSGSRSTKALLWGKSFRAGLHSVDPNQKETAQAFGMSRLQIMFRILIPQAMTAIIPPTGNQVISMVKATAMVSIIAMDDLLYSVQTIYNVTSRSFHSSLLRLSGTSSSHQSSP